LSNKDSDYFGVSCETLIHIATSRREPKPEASGDSWILLTLYTISKVMQLKIKK